MVDDVVAMGRAGPRLGNRRGVDVADPKGFEIRHQILGIAEGEAAMELQPIGGAERDLDGGRAAHAWAERRRASSTIDAVRRNSEPSMIFSMVRLRRRRQLGCPSIVPGRFACSVSPTTSSS